MPEAVGALLVHENSWAVPFVAAALDSGGDVIAGGRMSGDKLQELLNEHARQGWRLRAITSTDIKGRIGPGGVEGLLVTFERDE